MDVSPVGAAPASGEALEELPLFDPSTGAALASAPLNVSPALLVTAPGSGPVLDPVTGASLGSLGGFLDAGLDLIAPSSCWGQQLNSEMACSPDFVPGRNHFKNHFCARCREHGVPIPAHRVRAVRAERRDEFENPHSAGMWSKMGTRLVNQTSTCVGPSLVIFRGLPADAPPSPLLSVRPIRAHTAQVTARIHALGVPWTGRVVMGAAAKHLV